PDLLRIERSFFQQTLDRHRSPLLPPTAECLYGVTIESEALPKSLYNLEYVPKKLSRQRAIARESGHSAFGALTGSFFRPNFVCVAGCSQSRKNGDRLGLALS